MDCGQEACSGLRKKKRTPPKPRRIQSRKIHLGKRSQIRIRCLRRIPEEGTNSGHGGRSGRCVQESAALQFKLLMELLWQYGVSLTLTRWLAAALQERKAAMRLGNWISTPQQLTMGLSQGSPLSPVLYNVYTKGLADLNSNGLSWVLTLADDGLIYKTASDISTAVTAVQEQLEKVSHW